MIAVDPVRPQPEIIARAASVLRAGGLVAFPTETVYGLGADALNPRAVAGIFAAKGRPANNPLIVHVADADQARGLTASWPDQAETLAARFWPGALTLVLPRGAAVPDVVVASGPTVAVRCPAHPVAAALIRAAGTPVAAPSANRASELSPTTAGHVVKALDGRIDLILDGGPTPGGLESTVLDLTSSPPRLLRPGLVPVGEIEAAIGPVGRPPAPDAVELARGPLPSPGTLPRHYAPRTPLFCFESPGEAVGAALDFLSRGLRVGWVGFEVPDALRRPEVLAARMPENVRDYTARLYET
ncbi:MAG TPA: L-threonylcarbamoyladenylate synthase, partial [Gemmataceae bacterium]